MRGGAGMPVTFPVDEIWHEEELTVKLFELCLPEM
jgi:hypothetical protein